MPQLTIREYNPDSGALLGNISVLDFGRITGGTTSRVKVIDVAFTEVSSVGNIKLGLISGAGLIVNSNPTDIASDGSAGNGRFGVESSATFDSTKASSALSRHFAGQNTTSTASNTNNVSIGSRTSALSDYVYLDIEVADSLLGAGNGSYKWFFDYA